MRGLHSRLDHSDAKLEAVGQQLERLQGRSDGIEAALLAVNEKLAQLVSSVNSGALAARQSPLAHPKGGRRKQHVPNGNGATASGGERKSSLASRKSAASAARTAQETPAAGEDVAGKASPACTCSSSSDAPNAADASTDPGADGTEPSSPAARLPLCGSER